MPVQACRDQAQFVCIVGFRPCSLCNPANLSQSYIKGARQVDAVVLGVQDKPHPVKPFLGLVAVAQVECPEASDGKLRPNVNETLTFLWVLSSIARNRGSFGLLFLRGMEESLGLVWR